MATAESPALSLTDWVVLGVLAEEPRHGFAVAKELGRDAELGQLWTVRRPLVYRAIDHLLEIGFAEPRFVEPGDQGPHRTVIAATRVGRARLRRWLDEPVEHPRDVRATLLVKLALRAATWRPTHAAGASSARRVRGRAERARAPAGVDEQRVAARGHLAVSGERSDPTLPRGAHPRRGTRASRRS